MVNLNIRYAKWGMLTLCLVAGVTAEEFRLDRSTTSGGAIIFASGGAFELSATVGRPDAGKSFGGPFSLSAGFWFPLTPGDFDGTGTVDLGDFDALFGCMIGPDMKPAHGCERMDLDGDRDLDLRDFAVLASLFSGS